MSTHVYRTLDGDELTVEVPEGFGPPQAVNCPREGQPYPTTFFAVTDE